MAKGDRYSFYRFSGSQGRWMHIVMESLGVRGDDGMEATAVVGASWVDKPVVEPQPPAVPSEGAPRRSLSTS